MSELTTVSLVTIVAETALKTRLAKDLKNLGVSGYTVTAVNGKARETAGQATSMAETS